MTSIIDTHCHLDLNAFDDDRAAVIDRAVASDVHAMILIGYNPERWSATADLCETYPFLRRSVGLHPNDAALWSDELAQRMRDEIEQTSPLAVGEIGLDFFRSSDNRSEQVEAFERQVELARDAGLPVIIHQRAAERQVMDVLRRYQPVVGVMHCFTGGPAFAAECLEIGMHLGIGGVVTYPKSDDVRAAIAETGVDAILLETDAPFLAPQAHRGKRNESGYVRNVAEAVAACLGHSVDTVAESTTRNAIDLFGEELAIAVRSGMEFS